MASQAVDPEPDLVKAAEGGVEFPVEEDDIQIGYVEEFANVAIENDVDMEDEPPPMLPDDSDEDVGPAGPYDNESDSDKEDLGGDEPRILFARGILGAMVDRA